MDLSAVSPGGLFGAQLPRSEKAAQTTTAKTAKITRRVDALVPLRSNSAAASFTGAPQLEQAMDSRPTGRPHSLQVKMAIPQWGHSRARGLTSCPHSSHWTRSTRVHRPLHLASHRNGSSAKTRTCSSVQQCFCGLRDPRPPNAECPFPLALPRILRPRATRPAMTSTGRPHGLSPTGPSVRRAGLCPLLQRRPRHTRGGNPLLVPQGNSNSEPGVPTNPGGFRLESHHRTSEAVPSSARSLRLREDSVRFRPISPLRGDGMATH